MKKKFLLLVFAVYCLHLTAQKVKVTSASGEMKTHTQIYQSQYAKMLASLLGFDYVAPTSSKN